MLSDVDSLLQAWISRETRVEAAIVNARCRENMEFDRIFLDPPSINKLQCRWLSICVLVLVWQRTLPQNHMFLPSMNQ